MEMQTEVQIDGDKSAVTNGLVTLIVTGPFLRSGIATQDHIEVKVTSDGIIVERWCDKHGEFTNSTVLFYNSLPCLHFRPRGHEELRRGVRR